MISTKMCKNIESRLTNSFFQLDPKKLSNITPDTRNFVFEQIQWAKGYGVLMKLIEEQAIYARQTSPLQTESLQNQLNKYFFSEEIVDLLCSPVNLSKEWQKQKTLQSILDWNNEQVIICYELNKLLLLQENKDEDAFLAALFLTNLRNDVPSFWLIRANSCRRLAYNKESLNCAFNAVAQNPWAVESFRELFYLLLEEKLFDQAQEVLEIYQTSLNTNSNKKNINFNEEFNQAEKLLKNLAA